MDIVPSVTQRHCKMGNDVILSHEAAADMQVDVVRFAADCLDDQGERS